MSGSFHNRRPRSKSVDLRWETMAAVSDTSPISPSSIRGRSKHKRSKAVSSRQTRNPARLETLQLPFGDSHDEKDGSKSAANRDHQVEPIYGSVRLKDDGCGSSDESETESFCSADEDEGLPRVSTSRHSGSDSAFSPSRKPKKSAIKKSSVSTGTLGASRQEHAFVEGKLDDTTERTMESSTTAGSVGGRVDELTMTSPTIRFRFGNTDSNASSRDGGWGIASEHVPVAPKMSTSGDVRWDAASEHVKTSSSSVPLPAIRRQSSSSRRSNVEEDDPRAVVNSPGDVKSWASLPLLVDHDANRSASDVSETGSDDEGHSTDGEEDSDDEIFDDKIVNDKKVDDGDDESSDDDDSSEDDNESERDEDNNDELEAVQPAATSQDVDGIEERRKSFGWTSPEAGKKPSVAIPKVSVEESELTRAIESKQEFSSKILNDKPNSVKEIEENNNNNNNNNNSDLDLVPPAFKMVVTPVRIKKKFVPEVPITDKDDDTTPVHSPEVPPAFKHILTPNSNKKKYGVGDASAHSDSSSCRTPTTPTLDRQTRRQIDGNEKSLLDLPPAFKLITTPTRISKEKVQVVTTPRPPILNDTVPFEEDIIDNESVSSDEGEDAGPATRLAEAAPSTPPSILTVRQRTKLFLQSSENDRNNKGPPKAPPLGSRGENSPSAVARYEKQKKLKKQTEEQQSDEVIALKKSQRSKSPMKKSQPFFAGASTHSQHSEHTQGTATSTLSAPAEVSQPSKVDTENSSRAENKSAYETSKKSACSTAVASKSSSRSPTRNRLSRKSDKNGEQQDRADPDLKEVPTTNRQSIAERVRVWEKDLVSSTKAGKEKTSPATTTTKSNKPRGRKQGPDGLLQRGASTSQIVTKNKWGKKFHENLVKQNQPQDVPNLRQMTAMFQKGMDEQVSSLAMEGKSRYPGSPRKDEGIVQVIQDNLPPFMKNFHALHLAPANTVAAQEGEISKDGTNQGLSLQGRVQQGIHDLFQNVKAAAASTTSVPPGENPAQGAKVGGIPSDSTSSASSNSKKVKKSRKTASLTSSISSSSSNKVLTSSAASTQYDAPKNGPPPSRPQKTPSITPKTTSVAEAFAATVDGEVGTTMVKKTKKSTKDSTKTETKLKSKIKPSSKRTKTLKQNVQRKESSSETAEVKKKAKEEPSTSEEREVVQQTAATEEPVNSETKQSDLPNDVAIQIDGTEKKDTDMLVKGPVGDDDDEVEISPLRPHRPSFKAVAHQSSDEELLHTMKPATRTSIKGFTPSKGIAAAAKALSESQAARRRSSTLSTQRSLEFLSTMKVSGSGSSDTDNDVVTPNVVDSQDASETSGRAEQEGDVVVVAETLTPRRSQEFLGTMKTKCSLEPLDGQEGSSVDNHSNSNSNDRSSSEGGKKVAKQETKVHEASLNGLDQRGGAVGAPPKQRSLEYLQTMKVPKNSTAGSTSRRSSATDIPTKGPNKKVLDSGVAEVSAKPETAFQSERKPKSNTTRNEFVGNSVMRPLSNDLLKRMTLSVGGTRADNATPMPTTRGGELRKQRSIEKTIPEESLDDVPASKAPSLSHKQGKPSKVRSMIDSSNNDIAKEDVSRPVAVKRKEKKPKKTMSLPMETPLEPEGIHAKTAKRLSKRGLKLRSLSHAETDSPGNLSVSSCGTLKKDGKVPKERRRRSLSPKIALGPGTITRPAAKLPIPKKMLSLPIQGSDDAEILAGTKLKKTMSMQSVDAPVTGKAQRRTSRSIEDDKGEVDVSMTIPSDVWGQSSTKPRRKKSAKKQGDMLSSSTWHVSSTREKEVRSESSSEDPPGIAPGAKRLVVPEKIFTGGDQRNEATKSRKSRSSRRSKSPSQRESETFKRSSSAGSNKSTSSRKKSSLSSSSTHGKARSTTSQSRLPDLFRKKKSNKKNGTATPDPADLSPSSTHSAGAMNPKKGKRREKRRSSSFDAQYMNNIQRIMSGNWGQES